MPNYQKGKIYQIWDENYQECYIGSTVQELSMRMCGHRKDYRRFKEGQGSYTTVYKLFDKYHETKCRIELMENYACNSKQELERREGELIRNTECVNKNIAGRTAKERYEDDRDKYLEKFRQYHKNNTERRSEYHKEYRENNKDKLKVQKRKDYENRRETVLTKLRQPWVCECGITTTVGNKCHHLKSPKHQHYLNQINQQEPPDNS